MYWQHCITIEGVAKGSGELLRTTQLILLLEDYTIHSRARTTICARAQLPWFPAHCVQYIQSILLNTDCSIVKLLQYSALLSQASPLCRIDTDDMGRITITVTAQVIRWYYLFFLLALSSTEFTLVSQAEPKEDTRKKFVSLKTSRLDT